jgi:formate hydrogenlyase transcriptional activator
LRFSHLIAFQFSTVSAPPAGVVLWLCRLDLGPAWVDDFPEYFFARYPKKAGKNIRHVDKKTLALFNAYHWPGNIRELQNVVERAVILTEGDTFSIDESWLTPLLNKARVGERALRSSSVGTTGSGNDQGCISRIRWPHFGTIGGYREAQGSANELESKIRRLGIDKPGHQGPIG